MSTEHIVTLLMAERDRIQAAITALHGTPEPEPNNVPHWVLPKTAPKRKMSAAARKRIGEATKKRWEARRAALAQAVAPKPEDAKFKSKLGDVLKKATRKKKAGAKRRADVK